jgi:aminomethyltransferase
MGYIDVAFAKENSDVYILIRDQKIKAKVVKYPFYKG